MLAYPLVQGVGRAGEHCDARTFAIVTDHHFGQFRTNAFLKSTHTPNALASHSRSRTSSGLLWLRDDLTQVGQFRHRFILGLDTPLSQRDTRFSLGKIFDRGEGRVRTKVWPPATILCVTRGNLHRALTKAQTEQEMRWRCGGLTVKPVLRDEVQKSRDAPTQCRFLFLLTVDANCCDHNIMWGFPYIKAENTYCSPRSYRQL